MNRRSQLIEALNLDVNSPEYSADTQHRLFVYGTLKRGFHNNGFLDEAEFLTDARTAESNFIMLDFGGIPGVYKGGDFQIYGEIWNISGCDLLNCDLLEGNGHFYKRELINCKDQDQPAWMYILQVDPNELGYHFDGVRQIKIPDSENEKVLYWLGEVEGDSY